MTLPRVGVIGAGVAGPVLGILLKSKGYEPVIYERLPAVSQAGLMIGLQQNGIRVLEKIPGLMETIHGKYMDRFGFYSVLPEDLSVIGEMQNVDQLRPLIVRRSELQNKIVAWAEKSGVEFKWGHQLEKIAQNEDSVNVTFSNGVQETFSFVVGCDGLHSNTRICLFGKEPADFTGLMQCGGFAPIPDAFRAKKSGFGMTLFGDGVHMAASMVDDDTVGFAVTRRAPEAKEDWGTVDEAGAQEFKNSSISEWPFGAGDIVKNGWGIIRYGLYDRPELETWHQGRVLLIGDAAHPTSPHLGQGGNQAFEDADHLIQLLEKHNPSAGSPSTATLEALFKELEEVRIPRTAELVKRARAQGETRVVHGAEACIKRNNWYRELCRDKNKLRAQYTAGDSGAKKESTA